MAQKPARNIYMSVIHAELPSHFLKVEYKYDAVLKPLRQPDSSVIATVVRFPKRTYKGRFAGQTEARGD